MTKGTVASHDFGLLTVPTLPMTTSGALDGKTAIGAEDLAVRSCGTFTTPQLRKPRELPFSRRMVQVRTVVNLRIP